MIRSTSACTFSFQVNLRPLLPQSLSALSDARPNWIHWYGPYGVLLALDRGELVQYLALGCELSGLVMSTVMGDEAD
jgi:hypothetical protein